jgi:hypothetical protein
MAAAEKRRTTGGASADSVVTERLRPREPLRHLLAAMRMYYNGRVFKADMTDAEKRTFRRKAR